MISINALKFLVVTGLVLGVNLSSFQIIHECHVDTNIVKHLYCDQLKKDH